MCAEHSSSAWLVRNTCSVHRLPRSLRRVAGAWRRQGVTPSSGPCIALLSILVSLPFPYIPLSTPLFIYPVLCLPFSLYLTSFFASFCLFFILPNSLFIHLSPLLEQPQIIFFSLLISLFLSLYHNIISIKETIDTPKSRKHCKETN